VEIPRVTSKRVIEIAGELAVLYRVTRGKDTGIRGDYSRSDARPGRLAWLTSA
jgi:hypothetical protein